MKIGIIGSGDVGQHLGAGFVTEGHEVKMGTRDPRQPKIVEWVKKTGPRASAGSFDEAAKFGEVVVLSTLWSGTENAIQMAGPKNLAGKVVIDTTNPLVFAPNAPPSLALGHTDSAGEQVQRWLPESKVVKAFNIVGNGDMVHPAFPGGPPDMIICGNDAGAKEKVTELLKQFGWPGAVDIGGIEGARLLEPMCILWVLYGMRTQSWSHAFKFLRR